MSNEVVPYGSFTLEKLEKILKEIQEDYDKQPKNTKPSIHVDKGFLENMYNTSGKEFLRTFLSFYEVQCGTEGCQFIQEIFAEDNKLEAELERGIYIEAAKREVFRKATIEEGYTGKERRQFPSNRMPKKKKRKK